MMPTDNLLLACYELGHQPLSLAWPLAGLRQAGYEAQGVDLSVEAFPDHEVSMARFIAISVPMHTAMRLGVQAAQRVRTLNPGAHICFYGSYAWLNADYLLSRNAGVGQPLADSIIAGEVEGALTGLVAALNNGLAIRDIHGVKSGTKPSIPVMERLSFPIPDRSTLPDLRNYAHFAENGHRSLSGYVEATRGCLHKCQHCPIVPVYNGRFFTVPAEIVLADIRQQVDNGAAHITFGDPDFLNGPGHALKVIRGMHREFPHLTFNFTTKVEHIIEKQKVIGELGQLGAAFMVSAFESTSDEVLERMQKGHTVADLDLALGIADTAGIPIQPTWVPFTPWNTLEDYLALLTWIESRGLVGHVPPIQLSIRLLIPPGSALTTHHDAHEWLGELDQASFTHQWRHKDPRLDSLQVGIAQVAERSNGTHYESFAEIKNIAFGLIGSEGPTVKYRPENKPAPPKLTEDWFC